MKKPARFALKQVLSYNCAQVFLPREHLLFIQVQELFSNTSIRLKRFLLVFFRIFRQLQKSIEVQLRRIVVQIHVHVGYCNAEFIRRLFFEFFLIFFFTNFRAKKPFLKEKSIFVVAPVVSRTVHLFDLPKIVFCVKFVFSDI